MERISTDPSTNARTQDPRASEVDNAINIDTVCFRPSNRMTQWTEANGGYDCRFFGDLEIHRIICTCEEDRPFCS